MATNTSSKPNFTTTKHKQTIRDEIQDSKRVVLDGLGSFKIGISSLGAETVADFNVAQNITGAGGTAQGGTGEK